MSYRYDHWFWNSRTMNWFAQQMANFATWLWNKQYMKRP